MNIVKEKKEQSVIFLLTVFLAVLISIANFVPAFASELELNGIDRNRPSSITMTVNRDEWYVDGTTFRLYKVADLSDDLTFSYVDAFKNCNINVGLTPNSVAMDTASSLIQYIRDNNIQEDMAVQIHNRTMTFSGLGLGLYLIQGDTAREGTRTVTYQPVVICIPQRNSTTENWKYDITSQVKSADPQYVSTQTPSTEETETPEEPASPTTPSNPSTTSGTTTTSKKVKTGDTSRTGFYLTVTLIDVAAIAAIVLIRNRMKRSGR